MSTATQKFALVAARIFGQTINPTAQRNGMKYLRQRLVGESYLRWFPPNQALMHKVVLQQTRDNLYLDEDLEYQLEKKERLKARGKGPPKKGAGKRATIKKK